MTVVDPPVGKGEDKAIKPIYLVTDLDGTLVDRSQLLVPANLNVLERFQEAGNQIVFATGRSEAATLRYHREMNLDTPAILYNGARVVDIAKGSVLMERCISRRDHTALWAVGRRLDRGFTTVMFAGSRAYVHRKNALSEEYARKDGLDLEPIEEWSAAGRPDVTKFLFIGPESEMAHLLRTLVSVAPTVSFVQSERTYLEALPPQTDKGVALRWLMKWLDLVPGQVVAVGDNLNDVELLRTAGLGVCVGDGHPGLKAVADRVVSPCSGGAVADAAYLGMQMEAERTG